MKSLQHKDQKVAVLIDVQNMYYSAKHMFNAKVNFKEILKTAVAGRRLIRAISYVIEADIKGEDTFHKALESIGIEVKSKALQQFTGGAKKGDWDIGLAMDAVRLSNKVDTLVIISGDGDFKDLLIYLKTHGLRTEIMAFNKTASILIKREADLFTDMELDKRKYLIPMTKGGSRNPASRSTVKPAASPASRSTVKPTAPKSVVKPAPKVVAQPPPKIAK